MKVWCELNFSLVQHVCNLFLKIGFQLAAISKVLLGLFYFVNWRSAYSWTGSIEIRPLIVILKRLRMLIYNSVTSFYVSAFSFKKTRSNCVCSKGLWLMHRINDKFSVILCGYGTWFYIELQTKTDGVL